MTESDKNDLFNKSVPQITGTENVIKEDELVIYAARQAVICMENIRRIYQAPLEQENKAELAANDLKDFNSDDLPASDPLSLHLFRENHLANKREKRVMTYYAENNLQADTGNVSFDLLEKEHLQEATKRALALWFLAETYLENEYGAVKEHYIRQPMKVPDFTMFERTYVDGFLKGAVVMLQNAGETEQADTLKKEAALIQFDAVKAHVDTPEQFGKARLSAEYQSISAVNSVLDPCGIRDMPYTAINETWEKKMKQCIALVSFPEKPFDNSAKILPSP